MRRRSERNSRGDEADLEPVENSDGWHLDPEQSDSPLLV